MTQHETPLMTINDVARYLAVNRKTIYRMHADGRLIGYRVGHHLRFKLAEVQEMIDASRDRA